MRIRRHSRGKKYTGPYGAATVLRDEKNARVGFDAVAHRNRNATSSRALNARVGFDAVAHRNRNATSSRALTSDEKEALQKKNVTLSYRQRRRKSRVGNIED